MSSRVTIFTIHEEDAGFIIRALRFRSQDIGVVWPAPDQLPVVTLSEARTLLPPEATTWIERSRGDHPTVVESWLAVMSDEH